MRLLNLTPNVQKYIKMPEVWLLILACAHMIFVWPGIMTPDSWGQYTAAQSGVYSDHHPALMSIVWRCLLQIYPHPEVMLVLHLALLYGSVYYLMQACSKAHFKKWVLLLPVMPVVAVYSSHIWKDVSFAYSFLFVGAQLSYLTLTQKRFTLIRVSVLFCVLIYGTSVKFQAQYCAPILLLWTAYAFNHYRFDIKKILAIFLGCCIALYGGLKILDHSLMKDVVKNHSWQYVKIYDLSAISVKLDTCVVPDVYKTDLYSMDELKKRFNHQCVDDLVFARPIFKITSDPIMHQVLLKSWQQQVIKHPLIYLNHRLKNLCYSLLGTPGFIVFIEYLDQNFANSPQIYQLLYIVFRIYGYLFLAHFLQIIGSIIYCIFALNMLKQTRAAIPLLFLNATGLMMVGCILFLSMAGTPRYAYISVCLFNASHLFAYECWRARRGKGAPESLQNMIKPLASAR